jgi:hypothetical protein
LLLTLLLCSLVWAGLERVSLAQNLTASSTAPAVNFDDTDTSVVTAEWQIVAASQIGFFIDDNQTGTSPFHIDVGAPTNSLFVAASGNVGLGTSSPAQKLQLAQDLSPTMRFEQLGTQIGNFTFPPRIWDIQASDDVFVVRDTTTGPEPLAIRAGAATESFVIGTNGKVGFGTFSPQGNLHINGGAAQDIFSGMGPDLNAGPAFNFGYSGASFGAGTGFFNVRGTASGMNPSLRFATVNQQRLIITNAGRVGINNLAPSQQLDVTGNIRASGSFIAGGTTLNVPDYVFEPDYKLMPLTTLAAYVEKEKHLPDIPSAQEIKEQGVNMSELQMQLLKKVEELTLYTLEQEKTNQQQETLIHKQEQTISALTDALAEVKARLAALEQGYH